MYLRNFPGRSLAAIFAVALASCACAMDGAYDPTFGNGGRDWIDVSASSSYDFGNKILLLPSGNLAMFGGCGYNPSPACAAWLTPTGSLASGYGTAGAGTASFSAFAGWPIDASLVRDAAALTDGRVVAVVSRSPTPNTSYIALLRANGSGLDPLAANGAGFISVPFEAHSVRVTPQQQIIVAGLSATGSPHAVLVARYDAQLHLDTNFGTGGSTTIGITSHDLLVHDMTLQRDGKIVVIGTDLSASPEALLVVRLTSGGVADTAFGNNFDGRFTNPFAAMGSAGEAIVEDKKGRLVFVGFVNTSALFGTQWLVGRLLGGGAVDPGFNGGQPHQFTINGTSQEDDPMPCCVAMQSDSRIIVAGSMDRESSTFAKYFALARFTDAGAFDPTWGIDGQSYGDMTPQIDAARNDTPTSMALVPGGMVIGGYSGIGNTNETRFSATRLTIDLLFAADFE